jgi:hypothetical protein
MSSVRKLAKRVPGAKRLYHGLRGAKAAPRTQVLRALPQRSVGAEIGVHEGDFSAHILDIVRPRRLHLIDPWQYQEDAQYQQSLYGQRGADGAAEMDARFTAVCERFRRESAAGAVLVHRSTSSAAALEIPDGSLDWVYVDGDHLYSAVRDDLVTYAKKLKPGGILAGDDYGVVGWWEDGVRRAVDEFAATCPAELEVIGSQFLLRFPASAGVSSQ